MCQCVWEPQAGGLVGRASNVTQVQPNTYEDAPCQEINYPYERFFSFFLLSGFRWRQQ